MILEWAQGPAVSIDTAASTLGSARVSRRGRRGSVMVEFAFCAPLLILMALGVADLARMMSESIAMSTAARLGAAYGTQPGKASDFAGMQQAALNDLTNVSGVTVTASQVCRCSTTEIPCNATCSSSKAIFVKVTTSKQFRALAPIAELPTGFWLTNEAILRAK